MCLNRPSSLAGGGNFFKKIQTIPLPPLEKPSFPSQDQLTWEHNAMAKKVVDPAATALAALARALSDAGPKLLFAPGTTPSFFGSKKKADEPAAHLCVDRGWLQSTGEFVGKGKSKQEKYRLTPEGVRAALEQSETPQLLRGLGEGLNKQVEHLKAVRDQIGQLLGEIGPVVQSVAALERRIQPPSLEEIRKQLGSATTPAPASPRALPSAWQDRVAQLAAEQRARDRFQPVSLPALLQKIRGEQPDLTLGQYHDGLRSLRQQGRIRLIPFTRALATIDDPSNALFLDGEVMYYVDVP
jgi:hypothetical protein